MAYYPTEPPKDPAALAEWLRLEMQRLARELNAHQDVLRVSEYNKTPEKPRKGDIRLADGTNWNPVSAGQGPVWHDGTQWQGFGGAGSGGCQVDEYTTAGSHTWTKPTGAVAVFVDVVGSGGGGGSGRRGAESSFRGGGAGGGGGARFQAFYDAADLGTTVSVYVGAGGTGGAAVTVNDTDGNPGNDGETSWFGSGGASDYSCEAGGGKGGVGGTNAATAGGDGGGAGYWGAQGTHSTTYTHYSNPLSLPVTWGYFPGRGNEGDFGTSAEWGGGGGGGVSTTGQYETDNGTNPANAQFGGGSSLRGAPGGGAGGARTASNVAQRGGRGGVHGSQFHFVQAGSATGSGSNGANYLYSSLDLAIDSQGARGGESGTTGVGGNGGNGGRGGGGGGGGASQNGQNSGAGGTGGTGYVRVVTFF